MRSGADGIVVLEEAREAKVARLYVVAAAGLASAPGEACLPSLDWESATSFFASFINSHRNCKSNL